MLEQYLFSGPAGAEGVTADDVKVYRNPNPAEVQAIFRVSKGDLIRGTILIDGTILIWDGYLADHNGIETLLYEKGYENGPIRIMVDARHWASNTLMIYETDIEGNDEDEDHDPQIIARMRKLLTARSLTRMFGRQPKITYDF